MEEDIMKYIKKYKNSSSNARSIKERDEYKKMISPQQQSQVLFLIKYLYIYMYLYDNIFYSMLYRLFFLKKYKNIYGYLYFEL